MSRPFSKLGRAAVVEDRCPSSRSLADALVLALATYQATDLLTVQEGPFGVFARARDVGVKYSELAVCPYCQGVWIGAVLFLLARTPIGKLFVAWMAVCGLHSLLVTIKYAISFERPSR
jgi:hypothetical protein